MKIIDVTPDNIAEYGLYCLKDQKASGFLQKKNWFEVQHAKGLKLKIILNDEGEQAGFIEYVPASGAWRPGKNLALI